MQKTQAGHKFHEIVKVRRFGQPSLLQLNQGEVLTTHWKAQTEEGDIVTAVDSRRPPTQHALSARRRDCMP